MKIAITDIPANLDPMLEMCVNVVIPRVFSILKFLHNPCVRYQGD